jgi:hypothetical protein
MAYRVFDIFNALFGTTKVVGAESFQLVEGYRVVASKNDGMPGTAARDKTRFFATGQMVGQDIASFGTLIGLWEAAVDSLAVLAEGKLAGDAAKSVRLTLAHAKLLGATLSFQPGQHARSTFNFANNTALASDGAEHEVTALEVASKTILHASGYRGVKIKSAVFGGITPLGVTGLELNVSGEADQAAGDNEFGESTEVGGFEVTGTLGFQDLTIASAATVAQRLMAAAAGDLVVTYTQQGAQADKVLTLKNLQFEEDTVGLAARKFHSNGLKFGCFCQAGATIYKVGGDATNNIISVA